MYEDDIFCLAALDSNWEEGNQISSSRVKISIKELLNMLYYCTGDEGSVLFFMEAYVKGSDTFCIINLVQLVVQGDECCEHHECTVLEIRME